MCYNEANRRKVELILKIARAGGCLFSVAIQARDDPGFNY